MGFRGLSFDTCLHSPLRSLKPPLEGQPYTLNIELPLLRFPITFTTCDLCRPPHYRRRPTTLGVVIFSPEA